MDYTITLSTAEGKALSYAAVSPTDWIDNAVHDRCRIAIDEIVQIAVQKCLETETEVPLSKEAIVDLAFEQGWVKTAAEQRTESGSSGATS